MKHFCVEQVISLLDHQREVIKHIRTQALVAASYNFLIARFLAPTNDLGELRISSVFDYLAIVCFLGAIFFSLGAALMRPNWFFGLSKPQADMIFELEPDLPVTDIERIKTDLLYRLVDTNRVGLTRANIHLGGAVILSTAQLFFWLC